jgi:hypothetical protein
MAIRDIQPDEFPCYDLYKSAYIKAHDVPLLRTERVGTRVRFVFPGGSKTAELCAQFVNNGLVRVGDFRRCLNDLKTEIFSAA